jgi:prepilin-type N-terminal cleavage/methylation domain-containing protein
MTKRKALEKDQRLKSRNGFTLIELVVAMAILFILIYMGFSAFSFTNTLAKANQNREAVLENVSTVLDQMTKELRQTFTAGPGKFGVEFPAYSSSSDTLRDITTISTPTAPLASGQYYLFGTYDTESGDDALHPILRFYMMDDTGVKHRVSYTLVVPNDGSGFAPPHYKGIQREYWPDSSYEPCEILYSNETWEDSNHDGIEQDSEWTKGIHNQPVTDQVITNFTVTRPLWSDKGKVIQIVIEAMMKDHSGKPVKITRIAQVTLRQ